MESILQSVKSLLGLPEEIIDLDNQIMMHINSAIFTLAQLGIGPSNIFRVKNAEDTYKDYLGEDEPRFPEIPIYLGYKTRLGFDPPSTSYLIQELRNEIDELEWRMKVEAEFPVGKNDLPKDPDNDEKPDDDS